MLLKYGPRRRLGLRRRNAEFDPTAGRWYIQLQAKTAGIEPRRSAELHWRQTGATTEHSPVSPSSLRNT